MSPINNLHPQHPPLCQSSSVPISDRPAGRKRLPQFVRNRPKTMSQKQKIRNFFVQRGNPICPADRRDDFLHRLAHSLFYTYKFEHKFTALPTMFENSEMANTNERLMYFIHDYERLRSSYPVKT